MADYETGYQALNAYSDDPDEHDDTPPTENLVQHPDQNKGKDTVAIGHYHYAGLIILTRPCHP